MDEHFTNLERYPLTPAGNVAFLEFVRDDVHFAADMKRSQHAERYSNATIESAIHLGLVREAQDRIAMLAELGSEVTEPVTRVLRRELTVATVEQIDGLLTAAVNTLRNGFEEFGDRLKDSSLERFAALLLVKRELEQWNRSHSPSETQSMVEVVSEGHPLKLAVSALQRFYGGVLPHPAFGQWKKFLRLTREGDEDAHEEVMPLLDWLQSELDGLQRRPKSKGQNIVEVQTVGDFWKALCEGMQPAVAVSAVSIRPGQGISIAQPTFPQTADEKKWCTLDRAFALCEAEGGDRADAMRKLIAQTSLARGLERREIINMPLVDFVAKAADRSGASEPISKEAQLGESKMTTTAPKVFISYSWDDNAHKGWVKDFGTRLRTKDGVDVTLDHWENAPGDQLPAFMERAIRDNDYVLIVCTPKYKSKSDKREGGVGYEGDIMTGEVFAKNNHRKFIPILRRGNIPTDLPSWLQGKYAIDLSRDPYDENQYADLIATLFKRREQAPPLGKPSAASPRRAVNANEGNVEFEPIRITHIMVDEVGEPRNDGTRGSALYSVPFKLSRVPPPEWSNAFVRHWDHPPSFTTGHRPGTAAVQGDRVVLLRTTIDEVEDTHRATLKLVVAETNKEIAELTLKRNKQAELNRQSQDAERERIRKRAAEMDFS